MRSPLPLPPISAHVPHIVTASRKATDSRTPQYIRVCGPRARSGGPQPVALSRRARGLSGPFGSRAPCAARAEPKDRSRFGGLLGVPPDPGCRGPASGSRHTVGVAGPGGLNFASSGGKLQRPSSSKTADLHSFGDYCRGDEPWAGNGTRILFKNSGACIAPQTGTRPAGSLDSARPAARPNPLTRQGTSTRPQQLA